MHLSKKLVGRGAGVLCAVLAGCGSSHLATPPPKPPSQVGAKAAPPAEPPSFASTIDGTIRGAWQGAGVTPSPRADDATYLRRVYVDVVGTIPTPEATRAFLADPDPDKRRKVVRTLVLSPAYVDHWTNYWDDVLMGQKVKGPTIDRTAFRRFLHERFAANTPWDRLVYEIVTATGQNGDGPKARAVLPLATPADGGAEAPDPAINGAVNWTLRFGDAPQDLAGNASRVFLGVQIQCAQCHDHRTEKWKMDDFRRFSSAFTRLRIEQLEPAAMGVVRRVELTDAPTPLPRFVKNAEIAPYARATPTALDGTDLSRPASGSTRQALGRWMTGKDNPWFGKAIVNRMWGHFLGRGFYDPVDDIRPSNPPAMGELLDAITADFVLHRMDLRYLVETLCATEVYQLASSTKEAAPETKLWERFHLVPLGPEELLNALFLATGVEDAARSAKVANVAELRAQMVRQYGTLFDVDEEQDAPDYSGTVSQALMMLNGALVGQGGRAIGGSALDAILSSKATDAERMDELAFRVFSRPATVEERKKWTAYLDAAPRPPAAGKAARPPKGQGAFGRLANQPAASDPRRAAYEDLLWAMLNTSEFAFNH